MILVTGASGFLGLHVVRALAGSGEPVRALVRSDAAARAVEACAGGHGAGIETVIGDVLDPESLAPAARGCRIAYHLAGGYRGGATALWQAHVDGTANLLGALGTGGRAVLVSSTSVYGWDRPWPADERTPPAPASAYGRAKLAAEQLLARWADGSGVVVRPTIVYGPGDRHGMLPRAAHALARGARLFPGDGTNRVHLLHVDDFVTGLLAAGEKGDGVFVLAGPEPAPIGTTLRMLAASAGLPSPVFGVPAAAALALAGALEGVWRRSGSEGPLSRHSVEVATRDRAYSAERAASELGWRPSVSLDDGIRRLGTWLVAEDPVVSRRAARPATAPRSSRTAQDPPPATVHDHAGGPRFPGPQWRVYFEDPDEGLGTVYERFGLSDLLDRCLQRTGSASVLHAPAFGMIGTPGLDGVFQARRGVPTGLLDVDPERLAAVEEMWAGLGLSPTAHLAPWPDISAWPELLPDSYDLVFSFAGLWWFEDPWAVLAAQARWARKAVLYVIPNRNVFMALRARLWHRDMFDQLNEDAMSFDSLSAAADRLGLDVVEDGWFDLPPFPDTSVPLRQVLMRALGRSGGHGEEGDGAPRAPEGGAWRWAILPHLQGEDPDLEERVRKFELIERRATPWMLRRFAHHRYALLVPRAPSPAIEAPPLLSAGSPTQMM